ncbi:hypothetical protein K504DRAFT_74604 [Pleomassaria siparia CBS 279.74]|uniref:Uncharacterized protein n=1 Tax=Pleomassaria siparia CBS 279.74 TaxID=1314801 RepID=A0A6G1K0U4_9PLEO|nr:hypothetical protein K504DRAFT_74604 [Pleomassaria siparia CBS 279.74]
MPASLLGHQTRDMEVIILTTIYIVWAQGRRLDFYLGRVVFVFSSFFLSLLFSIPSFVCWSRDMPFCLRWMLGRAWAISARLTRRGGGGGGIEGRAERRKDGRRKTYPDEVQCEHVEEMQCEGGMEVLINFT